MSSLVSDPCILVLHGPEVFDSGDVQYLIDRLFPDRVIVAGVMARTAAEESGIACECIGVPPSWVIRDLDGCCVLANHGKTPESGRIFGEIVASRLLPRGLIHLECSDTTLYAWNRPVDREVRDIAAKMGYVIVPATVSEKGISGERTIRGCIEGEPVYVDGIVIGHATGPEVVLKASGGTILPVSGIVPKLHGLEKIRDRQYNDLSRVWCKSGTIRRCGPASSSPRRRNGRVLFIDHCGHHLYSLLTPDVCGIVSVGDDTTAVCGHICSHLGIPVFGIIDGDRDGIVEGRYASESVIACAKNERDDDIGAEIRELIPVDPVEWNAFVSRLLRHLGSRVTLSKHKG
jgi:hypothetical protein